jgi:hypothetical protein
MRLQPERSTVDIVVSTGVGLLLVSYATLAACIPR